MTVFDYTDSMEDIDSGILADVAAALDAYDTGIHGDLTEALDEPDVEGFAALLSADAESRLEEMAARAAALRTRYFGNSVNLFTPLYIDNHCENACTYCGFSRGNKIRRARLTLDEIRAEAEVIAATGLREILLLTGECRGSSDVAYIGGAVELLRKFFPTVGLEIYPLNVDEYAYLREKGADFVNVYQETYNPADYDAAHPAGAKRCYPYRFNAQERAIRGGFRGVAFGALLGLSDPRRDAFAAGLHAYYLQKKYPHAEVSFSFPRIRPHSASDAESGVSERLLLQIMAAYRVMFPWAGITVSTRERSAFRRGAIRVAANKMSAGVSVGVGGHESEQKGDGQFEIADPRSVAEVVAGLKVDGFQAVFGDAVI